MGWFRDIAPGVSPSLDPNASKMGAVMAANPQPQGSLAALGGGTGRRAPIYNPVQPPQNGPQPVPGMPPKQFDPNMGGGPSFPFPQDPNDPRYQPGGDLYFDPSRSSEGPGGFSGHGQDPNYWQTAQIPGGPYGNRGSGQPINQPLSPLLGGPLQDNGAALGQATDQGPYGQKTPQQIQQYLQQGGYQGMGSLQSLGGGQQSIGIDGRGVNSGGGMVTLRGTDGTTKAVPQQDLAHWLSKGAVRV